MVRRLIIVAGVLAALLGVAMVAAIVYLPGVLSTFVAQTSGYPLQIESIKVRPWSGSVEVKGLVLKNPAGFPEDGFAEVAHFDAAVTLRSLIGTKQVEIRRLHLDLPYAAYVTTVDQKNNVLGFIDTFVDRAAQKDTSPGRAWIIRDLDLRLGKLRYADHSAGSRPREMNIQADLHLQLRDVTEPGQIVSPILSQLSLKGFTEFAGALTKSLVDLQTYSAITGTLLRGTGDLLGTGGRALQTGSRAIGDTLRRATGTRTPDPAKP